MIAVHGLGGCRGPPQPCFAPGRRRTYRARHAAKAACVLRVRRTKAVPHLVRDAVQVLREAWQECASLSACIHEPVGRRRAPWAAPVRRQQNNAWHPAGTHPHHGFRVVRLHSGGGGQRSRQGTPARPAAAAPHSVLAPPAAPHLVPIPLQLVCGIRHVSAQGCEQERASASAFLPLGGDPAGAMPPSTCPAALTVRVAVPPVAPPVAQRAAGGGSAGAGGERDAALALQPPRQHQRQRAWDRLRARAGGRMSVRVGNRQACSGTAAQTRKQAGRGAGRGASSGTPCRWPAGCHSVITHRHVFVPPRKELVKHVPHELVRCVGVGAGPQPHKACSGRSGGVGALSGGAGQARCQGCGGGQRYGNPRLAGRLA